MVIVRFRMRKSKNVYLIHSGHAYFLILEMKWLAQCIASACTRSSMRTIMVEFKDLSGFAA
jgi:hypothetical protein